MVVARRFLIAGHVQGVGFRFFVQDHASVEGVHGYVRNLEDGRVETVIEGDEEAVVRMERALWRGPAGARVESIDVEPATPARRPAGFFIR
jgi:acylphosphatase